MTRRITLVTAVAAAALVAGVPAAFADPWGADRQDSPSVVGSPDLADRVIAARQKELATMLDARERSYSERWNVQVQPATDSATRSFNHFIANDNRFRPRPTSPTVAVSASSGSEIEWPQIGFGAVLGSMVVLGLMIALRAARSRQLAH